MFFVLSQPQLQPALRICPSLSPRPQAPGVKNNDNNDDDDDDDDGGDDDDDDDDDDGEKDSNGQSLAASLPPLQLIATSLLSNISEGNNDVISISKMLMIMVMMAFLLITI